MNILLIGKDGQVGQELSASLGAFGCVTAIGRSEVDLLQFSALKEALGQFKPDMIVNAAAYTAVDKAETDVAHAFRINHEAVAELAEYAKQQKAYLVHYSTDYVFDGTKQGAYYEDDATRPINQYGASKLAGEQAILNSGCKGFIFRTSWVYAAHGHNFIKTILRLAQTKENISVVDDQKGVPTSAKLISDVTVRAMQSAILGEFTPGIYHLTPKGCITWYSLAHYLVHQVQMKGIDLLLSPDNITPIASADYPLPAKRPNNSTLNQDKLESSLDMTLPEWSIHVDMVIEQLIDMDFFNK